MQATNGPHDHLTALAATLIRDGRSDWRAGIGSLLREVEAREPGFIQKLAAIDQMRRLGLPVTEAWR